MRKIAILLATALLAAGPAAPCAADSLCGRTMEMTRKGAEELRELRRLTAAKP